MVAAAVCRTGRFAVCLAGRPAAKPGSLYLAGWRCRQRRRCNDALAVARVPEVHGAQEVTRPARAAVPVAAPAPAAAAAAAAVAAPAASAAVAAAAAVAAPAAAASAAAPAPAASAEERRPLRLPPAGLPASACCDAATAGRALETAARHRCARQLRCRRPCYGRARGRHGGPHSRCCCR
eukprot:144929-Chlamydomonas_euryale.AAC.2